MTEVTVNISMDSVSALITYQKFADIGLLSDLVYRKEKEPSLIIEDATYCLRFYRGWFNSIYTPCTMIK